jgi:hypothetical protein
MHMLSLILVGAAPAEQPPEFFVSVMWVLLGIAAIRERVHRHRVHPPADAGTSRLISRIGNRSGWSQTKPALFLIRDRYRYRWNSWAAHQTPGSFLLNVSQATQRLDQLILLRWCKKSNYFQSMLQLRGDVSL